MDKEPEQSAPTKESTVHLNEGGESAEPAPLLPSAVSEPAMTDPEATPTESLQTVPLPKSPLPNIGDIVFVCLMWLMLGALPKFLFGDGSTGWHLVSGHYVIDNLQVPRTDLVSHTFADKPWVSYEWLCDVLFAGLERLGGLNLLAIFAATTICGIFVALYEDSRRRGCHFGLALVLTIIALLTSSIHWLARPVLINFIAVYIFSKYLEKFRTGAISDLALKIILGITMLLWVNAHPAFFVGIVMTGIYLVCELISWLVQPAGDEKRGAFRRMLSLGTTLLLIGATTFITPYGVSLFEYISHYMKQSVVLSQTDEFRSPVFQGALHATCLELLFFALAIGLVTTRRKPALAPLLLVLAFAHLSLNAVRNEPLFAIVSLPFIAGLYANNALVGLFAGFERSNNDTSYGASNQPVARWLQYIRDRWSYVGKTFDEVELSCTMHIVPIAVVAVLSGFAIYSHLNGFDANPATDKSLVKSGFDAKSKPMETLQRLEQLANANKLDWKRGVNYDNWGGYIRYKTGQRVFIDDRADFYGEKFYLDYAVLAQLRPGWKEMLDKKNIQWVLFPKNSLLTGALKEKDSGWRVEAEDKSSTLMVRNESTP